MVRCAPLPLGRQLGGGENEKSSWHPVSGKRGLLFPQIVGVDADEIIPVVFLYPFFGSPPHYRYFFTRSSSSSLLFVMSRRGNKTSAIMNLVFPNSAAHLSLDRAFLGRGKLYLKKVPRDKSWVNELHVRSFGERVGTTREDRDIASSVPPDAVSTRL